MGLNTVSWMKRQASSKGAAEAMEISRHPPQYTSELPCRSIAVTALHATANAAAQDLVARCFAWQGEEMRICDSTEKFEENEGLTTRATNSYSKIVKKNIHCRSKKCWNSNSLPRFSQPYRVKEPRRQHETRPLSAWSDYDSASPVFMQGVGVFGVGNGDQR